MKEKKVLVIIFSIILLFVVILISILIARTFLSTDTPTEVNNIKEDTNEINEAEENLVSEPKEDSDEMVKLTNEKEYFSAKKYIDQYMLLLSSAYYINYGNLDAEELARIEEREVNYDERIISLIDKQAKADLNLTESTALNLYQKNISYTITKAFSCEKNNREVIFTKGIAGNPDKETEVIKDYCVGIIIDKENNTHSILPYEYMKKYYPQIVSKTRYLGSFDEIKDNGYNDFKFSAPKNIEMARCYLGIYKACALYDREAAWELLNAQYKEKKYYSFDKYSKYLKYNSDDIQEIIISTCETISSKYATCYDCKDTDDKELAITRTSLFDFTIQFED